MHIITCMHAHAAGEDYEIKRSDVLFALADEAQRINNFEQYDEEVKKFGTCSHLQKCADVCE
jgi:hypothetical protein